jgi:IS30 family transposase
MMSTYTQLTQDQRYQIEALLKAELNQTEIAEILDVHKSTISRELKRNKGLRGYRTKQAQRLADGRQANKAQTRIKSSTWALAEHCIREDWSPEQISGWLKLEKGLSISHEWIYLYIYDDKHQGGDLHRHLRCQKIRKKRYGSYDRRGQIKNRVSIDERPDIVDERSRIGDWEVDTVIGRPGGVVLVTLAERKSRLSLIALAANKTAQAVKEALLRLLRPIVDQVHTLTYDNGKEFAYHESISEALNASGFFAHPYHSWERGLNENTNGLIRQYLPKRMDFQPLIQCDIQGIMDKLNNRPRKCLGFKTPNQVFFGINPTVALAS